MVHLMETLQANVATGPAGCVPYNIVAVSLLRGGSHAGVRVVCGFRGVVDREGASIAFGPVNVGALSVL